MGATHPQEIKEIRKLCPRSFFLIPGLGAQGANPEDLKGAFNSQGLGALINVSRGINFAYSQLGYQSNYVTMDQYDQSVIAAITEYTQKLQKIIEC